MSYSVIDAINSVSRQIENVFGVNEKHKCFYFAVMSICDVNVESCPNIIKGIDVLCLSCLKMLKIHKQGIYNNTNFNYKFDRYEYLSIAQIKNEHTHLMFKDTCIVASCRKMGKHKRFAKLKYCSCFKKYDGNCGFTTFDAFKTLLFILVRFGNEFGFYVPKDIKMLLFKYIGCPKNYYFINGTLHSVFNVRTIKDRLKSDDFGSKICPQLAMDYKSIPTRKFYREVATIALEYIAHMNFIKKECNETTLCDYLKFRAKFEQVDNFNPKPFVSGLMTYFVDNNPKVPLKQALAEYPARFSDDRKLQSWFSDDY